MTEHVDPKTGEVTRELATTDRRTAKLTLRQPNGTEFGMQFEPANMGELMRAAEWFAATGLCGVKKPVDVFARVMLGAPLGLTFGDCVTGIYSFDSAQGPKAGFYAETVRYLCESRTDIFEQFDLLQPSAEFPADKVAVIRVKRVGKPAVDVSYTIDDAKRAGLVKAGSNWEKFPREMLVARVTTRAAKQYGAQVMRRRQSVEDIQDGLVDERGEELDGEIVSDTPKVAMAERDYELEAVEIESAVTAHTTSAEGKPLRARITAWDGPADRKARIVVHYDTRVAELKANKVKVAAQQTGQVTTHQEEAQGREPGVD